LPPTASMASRPTASRGNTRALESGINKAAADFTIAQERGGTGLGVPKGNKRNEGGIARVEGIEALRAEGVKAGG
jgi:hypothetical protein